jgi:hypothetical protein
VDKKPPRPIKQEKAPKAVKTDKRTEQKQPAGIGGGGSISAKSSEQAQQAAPSPAPELLPEPREALRSGKQEQIVYLNLSELHSFKDRPFQVRNDEEISNEVVAERNKMTVKQVQRYIKLNELVPDLMKMVDEKKIAFTPAVELAFIKPKNQSYIAIAIEGQQSFSSLSQAQRMRDLDQKKLLNADVIDGIMLKEKKEVDKVIISSQELSQYFGKDKTPRKMKDTIIKLLDEWKEKQPELAKPEEKAEQEK